MKDSYDAIVLGGGAAGLMSAIEAGRRGLRVLLLESTNEIGRKILISGGGRCNFTNLHCKPENFICSNPHFHKSALARYTPRDFIGLVEKYKIAYHEKTLGQLFCDRSARDIIQMLRVECDSAGVTILVNCRIAEVRRTTGFVVETGRGAVSAPALVVATGGLSIPKLGATSFGYDLARKFSIAVAPTRPALVPLTWSEADCASFMDLAGVSMDALASFGTDQFREKMLFTHRGLSGPAILQISSYWDRQSSINLDLLPNVDFTHHVAERRSEGDKASLKTILSQLLPKRFADRWFELNPGRAASATSLETSLHSWRVTPAGTEGYAKAEVTAGGVHPDELSSKTLESRRVPGLYFIGEVVDVTGQLGGFNFQWAWASGVAAGRSL